MKATLEAIRAHVAMLEEMLNGGDDLAAVRESLTNVEQTLRLIVDGENESDA